MVEDMPPGYRFYPTEEELISFYLHHKLEGNSEDLKLLMDRVIPEVNIYDYNPWDLPRLSQYLCHRDSEQWFFFIPRQENEARRARPNRLTSDGYWKATGSPGRVFSANNRAIGDKRTMVFYRGRAPNGKKTEWKMNEYKALDDEATTSSFAIPVVRQEFCLCRLYKKSKTLRSFDRRPPPLPGVVVREPRPQQAHDNEATITTSHHHRQASQLVLGKASSHETSQPLSDGELWWDLDQLNCFC